MSSSSYSFFSKKINPASPRLTQTNVASNGRNNVNDLCDNCGVNPKFVEDGRIHPYCGRRCASAHKRDSLLPTTRTQWQPQVQTRSQNDRVKAFAECFLQGCRNPGRPQFGGFCSDAHSSQPKRKNTVVLCSKCGGMPASSGDMCISCRRLQSNTNLKYLPNSDPNFQSVMQLFADNWDSSKRTPRVVKVLEVSLSRKERNSHDSYRKMLGRRSKPSEIMTFHSTHCICDLGTQPQQQLCENGTCGICSVVRSNFTDFGCGVKNDTGRFGPGVYSTTKSYIADKHATSCTTSPYRAMILCSTVVDLNSSADSIVSGDTVFVKDANAIIPTHIILYS